MDTAPRIARITTPASNGSGHVIAPRLVLTSAHVAPEVGCDVRVQTATDHQPCSGVVIWCGTPKGHDDAALIEVTDPDWTEHAVTTRWGRLVTTAPRTSCEVWGFPDLVQRDDRAAETAQLVGTVAPGNHFVNHRHVMDLSDHPPRQPSHKCRPQEQCHSLWAGLSGASVRCGDGQLLVGVVSADLEHRDHAALEIVPAYVLHHDPGFRKVLAEHGVSQVLEPVELAHLAHSPRTHQRPSPASLLEAQRRVVDFHGREAVMDTLAQWCEADEGLSAMVVHGPGGQGKTRLGHELTARLAHPDTAGRRWATVWLKDNATAQELDRVKDTTAPLLLVVDYAETRTAQLISLLRLCDRPPGSSPVRLLLLARSVGEWWEQVNTATGHLLADITQQLPLPPLASRTVERSREYHTSLHHLARALLATRTLESTDWAQVAAGLTEPDLSGSEWDTVLSVHMRALADLLDATHTSTMVTADSAVEGRVLAHEYRYWDQTAAAYGLGEAELAQPLRDVLALAFTLTPANIEEADHLLQEATVLEGQTIARKHQIRQWITSLYPTDGPGVCGQLQPDRLLEYFLGQRLERNPALFNLHLDEVTTSGAERLVTLYAHAATHPALFSVKEHLTRLCTRHIGTLGPAVIEVSTQTEDPSPLLRALDETKDDPGTPLMDLMQLLDAVPRFTQRLDEWAERLAARVVEALRERAAGDPGSYLLAFAGAAINHGIRLAALGWYEEAYEAGDRALSVLRVLSEDHPEIYLLNLANCLNNQASHLSMMGRHTKALKFATEAVEIYCIIPEKDLDTHDSKLATALNNKSNILKALGWHEQALEVNGQVLRIVCALAAKHPHTHLPDLAASLSHRSNYLSAIGCHEQALFVIEQSLGIRRQLDEQNPDAYRPELAHALNSHAADLGALGQHEEALESSDEAVLLYEELAKHQPKAYCYFLAIALLNQTAARLLLGQKNESLDSINRSVEIHRTLATENPYLYGQTFAESLHSQAAILANLGRTQEALQVVTQVIATLAPFTEDGSAVAQEELESARQLQSTLSEFRSDHQ